MNATTTNVQFDTCATCRKDITAEMQFQMSLKSPEVYCFECAYDRTRAKKKAE